MEEIYTNKRDLLEQATLQDRRKAFSICIFKFNARREYSSKPPNYS